MNAAILAVVKVAAFRGIEVLGVELVDVHFTTFWFTHHQRFQLQLFRIGCRSGGRHPCREAKG